MFSELTSYLKLLTKFPVSVRQAVRQKFTLDEARAIIRERLARREESFLEVAKQCIYANPASPYRMLLEMAGCEFGDLATMVKKAGIESTLRELREAGVYVTFEEYKKRAPIVRHGREIPAHTISFNNPLVTPVLDTESGGSTGKPMKRPRNLEYNTALTPHRLVMYAAHGVLDAPWATWRGILPDGSGLSQLQASVQMGKRMDRWFTHIGPWDSNQAPKYTLATYFAVFMFWLHGARVPWPEFVPVDQAAVIARWMAQVLKREGKCLIGTQVSRALRICLAAQEEGLDLTGAVFQIAGEPPTPAKVRQIHLSGARHFTTYGAEAGRMGMGCANPEGPNDVHLMTDMFAFITYPQQVPGFDITVPAFHATTLLSSAPQLMLNLALDDYGIMEQRRCGCEFEALGLTTHLRDIHSYRKLTGEGVTMIGSEMLDIIENVLPSRFGGSPLDYQLLEQEDEQGLTRLYVLVSPKVNLSNEQEVVDTVLEAMRRTSPQADATRLVWQRAGTLRVRREEPVWTNRGKLMPLRVERRASDSGRSNHSNTNH
jgi:hypothetical protein